MRQIRFRSIRWLTALLMAGSFAAVGHAQETNADLQAIGRMAKQGQRPAALAKLNDYLTQHPKDLPARFMKGVFLVEQAEQSRPKDSKEARDPNRYREAISVFYGIIKDHPDHPEPYNNLAAIYASLDQWDKAKEMLEAAIRTNPSYATAHENLGDVYAKLASQAYEKALQLDTNSPAVQNKLRMISDLFPQGGASRGSQQPQRTTVAAVSPSASRASARHGREAAAQPQPAAPAQQQVVASASPVHAGSAPARSTGGAFKPTTPGVITPAAPPAISAMSAAHADKSEKEKDKGASDAAVAKLPTPTPAKPEVVAPKKKNVVKNPEKDVAEKGSEKATAKDSDEEELKDEKGGNAANATAGDGQQSAVLDVVRSWATTWSKQDVSGYLGYYGDKFKPSGQSREAWKKQREERLARPKTIQVDVDNAKVRVKGDQATVTFKQTYKSDVVGRDSMVKRLILVKENGQWRIVRESGR